jgi:hypothetical protein
LIVSPGASDTITGSRQSNGVPAPAGLPGVDLLDDKAVAARRQIFGECFTHTLVDLDDPAKSLLWRWTIRDDEQTPHQHRWKLIVPTSATIGDRTGGGAGGEFPAGPAGNVDPQSRERWQQREVELFDLSADPGEQAELSARQPEAAAALRGLITAEQAKNGEASPVGDRPAGVRAALGAP